jgi:hypothetical protein
VTRALPVSVMFARARPGTSPSTSTAATLATNAPEPHSRS